MLLRDGASPARSHHRWYCDRLSQTSTYLQSTAKALGLAIERKEEHERQLAETRRRASEQNSHTEAECDNPLPPTSDASVSAEVVKH